VGELSDDLVEVDGDDRVKRKCLSAGITTFEGRGEAGQDRLLVGTGACLYRISLMQ
jgi:hypothetical protein